MDRPRAGTAGRRLALAALLATGGLLAAAAHAQSSRETERRLQTARKELQQVAAERRTLESRRGQATRDLRAADERVATSSRRLREAEQALAAIGAELEQLQARRDALGSDLAGRREELARLVRAAYAQGEATPLKLLLAQDRVADANRLLVYHRYLQRDRSRRIEALRTELAEIDTLEREIAARRQALDAAREHERAQLAALDGDRRARRELVAELDRRYQDRRSREQALGSDVRGLEDVLRKLRQAAARAEAERRAAAARAEREARESARRAGQPAPAPPTRAPAAVATGPQVGGAGWPLAGQLLAGYGARLPDGRGSKGLLIGAAAGTPVRAVAAGTVVYAEWMSGFGLILIVDHGNGYLSLYAHNDALLRDVGDAVGRGDQVATVGTSGGHGRPALYFELRRNGDPVDPAVWLKR